MSFTRVKDAAVNVIRKLPNRPTGTGYMSAAALKAAFDQAAENIKATVNTVLDEIEAASGAAQIGFRRSNNVPADTVQTAIENVQSQIRSVSQQGVANQSITAEKMADGAAASWIDVLDEEGIEKLEPYTSRDYDDNGLKFYYNPVLKIMRVEGWVDFTYNNLETPYVDFVLPGRLPDISAFPIFSQVSFSGNVNAPRFYLESRAQVIMDSHLRICLGTVSAADRGKQITVRLHGWYFCEGE